MSVRRAAVLGSITGGGVATVLLTLEAIRPFSPYTNAFIEELTFRLCPLYILGFAPIPGGMAGLIALTVLGNVILYAVGFTIIALIAKTFKWAFRI